MPKRLLRTLLISLVAFTLAACGTDDDATSTAEGAAGADDPAGITTRDAWIREAVLPEGSPTADHEGHEDDETSSGVISALYLVIENHGDEPVELTGVEADVARVVEIHQTENQNGLMKMRPAESVEIPAGGEVAFEPGGFHIMLIDINRALEPGNEVAVTLLFNTGDRLELPAVPVRES